MSGRRAKRRARWQASRGTCDRIFVFAPRGLQYVLWFKKKPCKKINSICEQQVRTCIESQSFSACNVLSSFPTRHVRRQTEAEHRGVASAKRANTTFPTIDRNCATCSSSNFAPHDMHSDLRKACCHLRWPCYPDCSTRLRTLFRHPIRLTNSHEALRERP